MMPGQHGTSLKDYTQALIIQLRLRKVPGAVIGQIVAEVESHVRETGEDPVEVFGQPGSYSAQYSGGSKPGGGIVWSTLRAGAATTVAVGGGLMLLEGLFNRTGVVRITASMLLSWVAVGLMFALVVCRVDDVMWDRQTRTVSAGREAPGSRAAYWLRFLALWVTLQVNIAIRSRSPEGPVLLRLPGGVLLLVGLALTAVSLWVYLRRSDRIVDPR
jgi:hypothetical protein